MKHNCSNGNVCFLDMPLQKQPLLIVDIEGTTKFADLVCSLAS